MSDGLARIIRSLLQLIAGGGLTALFMQLAKDVPNSYAPYIILASTGLVAIAQIGVEELTGKGLLRNASPPIQQLREPLKNTFALLVAIGLALTMFAHQANATGGNCDEWAAEINSPRDSYRMRQLGCTDEGTPGEYRARTGLCNQIARQAARADLRGNDAVVYVEDHEVTCYWDSIARNYGIRSVAW